MKCNNCNGELIQVEALNAYLVDFNVLDKKSKVSFNIKLNKTNISTGVKQGEVAKSYYCSKCRKMLIELNEIDF